MAALHVARIASDTLVFLARGFAKVARVALILARKCQAADTQRRNVIGSTSYDMVTAPDEPYYAEQYWGLMSRHVTAIPNAPQILDLGCSQGRFTVRLGQLFPDGHLTACDISSKAIAKAQQYAARIGLRNIEFRTESIADCLHATRPASVDLVVLTEVTFFYPNWQEIMPFVIASLKAGGLFVVSLQSQYFNSLRLAKERRWEAVESLITHRQGAIFGSLTTFTWHSSEEIRRMLTKVYGLELLELSGVGVCSGIPGDPHESICQPSELSVHEQRKLMQLEVEMGTAVPDAGRYIVAIARKPSLESAI